ncbi:MAG: hypothetical protein K6B65_03530 [Bacilli bacterium]|nr:hypothetical protein [Bacilli bacterium]
MEVASLTGSFRTLTVHPWDEENSTDSTYVFESSAVATYTYNENSDSVTLTKATGVTTFGLERYSLLEPSQPVLYLFQFEADTLDSEISIEATSSTETFLGSVENGLEAEDNPLSSVVKFSSISFGSTPSYSITKTDLSEEDHFVEMSQDGGTFNSYNKEKTFYFGTADSEMRYVGIVFDYYAEAMEYIYSMNLGNDVLMTLNIDEDVGFKFDWTVTL